MGLFKNLSKMAEVAIAAASGSILTVVVIVLLTVWPNETKLQPADNYGPENTWYYITFYDKTNFEGSWGKYVLGGVEQNICHNIKSIDGASDGKSVKVYDYFNQDSYLPQGMQIYLYWGKVCADWKPYGIITVPANAKEVRVPNVNQSSENYEVLNNFKKDRELAGHINGLSWLIPTTFE